MADQLRYNTGKPELHYLLSNPRTSIELIERYWPLATQMPTKELSRFLCRNGEGAAYCALAEIEMEIERLGLDVPAELASVYTRGAKKYARGNYRLGAPFSQYADCAARHLLKGTGRDEETACLHLAHAHWNITQILEQPASRDDRLPKVADPEDEKIKFNYEDSRQEAVLLEGARVLEEARREQEVEFPTNPEWCECAICKTQEDNERTTDPKQPTPDKDPEPRRVRSPRRSGAGGGKRAKSPKGKSRNISTKGKTREPYSRS